MSSPRFHCGLRICYPLWLAPAVKSFSRFERRQVSRAAHWPRGPASRHRRSRASKANGSTPPSRCSSASSPRPAVVSSSRPLPSTTIPRSPSWPPPSTKAPDDSRSTGPGCAVSLTGRSSTPTTSLTRSLIHRRGPAPRSTQSSPPSPTNSPSAMASTVLDGHAPSDRFANPGRHRARRACAHVPRLRHPSPSDGATSCWPVRRCSERRSDHPWQTDCSATGANSSRSSTTWRRSSSSSALGRGRDGRRLLDALARAASIDT